MERYANLKLRQIVSATKKELLKWFETNKVPLPEKNERGNVTVKALNEARKKHSKGAKEEDPKRRPDANQQEMTDKEREWLKDPKRTPGKEQPLKPKDPGSIIDHNTHKVDRNYVAGAGKTWQNITNTDVANVLSEKAGIKRSVAGRFMKAYWGEVLQSLKGTKEAAIPGVGVVKLKWKKSRGGMNPHTGQRLRIKGSWGIDLDSKAPTPAALDDEVLRSIAQFAGIDPADGGEIAAVLEQIMANTAHSKGIVPVGSLGKIRLAKSKRTKQKGLKFKAGKDLKDALWNVKKPDEPGKDDREQEEEEDYERRFEERYQKSQEEARAKKKQREEQEIPEKIEVKQEKPKKKLEQFLSTHEIAAILEDVGIDGLDEALTETPDGGRRPLTEKEKAQIRASGQHKAPEPDESDADRFNLDIHPAVVDQHSLDTFNPNDDPDEMSDQDAKQWWGIKTDQYELMNDEWMRDADQLSDEGREDARQKLEKHEAKKKKPWWKRMFGTSVDLTTERFAGLHPEQIAE